MVSKSKLLEINNLGKSFGGNWAIKGVDITVRKGELLGIIGPNGAGKTTLFNMVTGFLKPTEGIIRFKDKDIANLKPHNICNIGIARTFQIVKPFGNLSVLENVTIGVLRYERDVNKAKEIAREKVKLVGLEKYMDTTASSLPLGHRKRLEMARALATDPEVIMLDEVMGGLNDDETAEMMNLVKTLHNKGLTILLIEHNMHALMSLSERVVVLCYGKKLADGTTDEISSNQEVIEAYLGSDDDAEN
ncbi:ABC transporter ATP-binding protein [Alteribacillus iranensis]|uniref:Amino acid/amide ABC transporter ATP-binding protein 1, HAAT family n=1 Tax=Alteribacillus iranensis TaxID=930128 RepID=A0A1I2EJK9_9BACI|nr:ABC transporter ATP-binding protein [Alteribacillus iranensis]SFE93162.1 amino acid/amide ABC transporter ATP-binding protein 1, HAAT family [Alteribacillus iranensis]